MFVGGVLIFQRFVGGRDLRARAAIK